MSETKKTILITGATQGLGRELALKLADKKYNLILLARTQLMLQQTCQEIQKKGGKAEYLVCDIRDQDQVKKTVEDINARFKHLNVLINNAGVWTDNELEAKNPQLRINALQTNSLGTIQLTEALIPILKKGPQAQIINVISTSATSDNPAADNGLWRSYGASKWAIRGYTKDLRTSLAGDKIKVTAFYPGGFESNLYQNADRPNPHNQPWMMNTADVADQLVHILNQPEDVCIEEIRITKWIK